MNVGMTVLALLTCIGKNGIDMAFLTRNRCVQATQGKPRLGVIKFRLGAQWQPSFAGMAVLTRNLQRTMRISVRRCDAGIFLASSRAQEHEHEQEPDYIPGIEFSRQDYLFGSFVWATCDSCTSNGSSDIQAVASRRIRTVRIWCWPSLCVHIVCDLKTRSDRQ